MMNTEMPNQQIEVGFNAGRVCEAIARIGYEPHSAILDLVDNAVTAGATNVKISLNLAPGKSLKSRNSVRSYQIVDNGQGMDVAGIAKAFALGADVQYTKHSLSKYGLGLKSAGLSLGSRISIVSKRNGEFTQRYTFDKEVISAAGRFVIVPNALSPEQIDAYSFLLPDQSGTIVEVEGSETVNHPSPKVTVEKLRERVGVVYFSFLKRPTEPLNIAIRVCPDGTNEEFVSVQAKDMLFEDIPAFKEHWNPDTYDYASPYLALADEWRITGLNGNDLPPVEIRAVVFPQDSMKDTRSPLSPEQKELVASYKISRENRGFFIYRNGRLIRWGDDLGGLVGKDDLNIRIRIDLTTEHDDVLHVDVTKQRLEIDDESSAKLDAIFTRANKIAAEVRALCQEKLKAPSGNEGLAFTDTVRNVAEDDPEEVSRPEPTAETKERRKRRAEEGIQVADEVRDEQNEEGEASDFKPANEDQFRKIIYTDKGVPFGHVWKPFLDAKEGVFVCISKQHPFYQEILSRLPETGANRICLEALIFAAALGEINSSDTTTDIPTDSLERLFSRFHKNIGTWLNQWITENTNLMTEG
jgi:hypothetical protein